MTVDQQMRLLPLAAIGFAAFVLLSAVVHSGPAPGDEALTRVLAGHCPSALITRTVVHQPCPFGVQRILHDLDEALFSKVLSLPVWTVLVVALALELWRRDWRTVAVLLLLTDAAAEITTVITKLLVGRLPAPTGEATVGVQAAVLMEYPSGHILRATVTFGVLLAAVAMRAHGLRGVTSLACVAVLLLLGAMRVASEAHWPSDVLGSYLVGGAWVLIALSLPVDRWLKRFYATQPTPARSRRLAAVPGPRRRVR